MTGLIIAIVVIAIIALIVFAFVMPRARAKAREREMNRRRDEVATAHRERADDRAARADYAEQQAARERAEAELHQTRARMHERGLADDELDTDRERLGVADGDGRGERFATERDEPAATERDGTIAREERR
jgi:FtsZ-interacting cell division protein ZipA